MSLYEKTIGSTSLWGKLRSNRFIHAIYRCIFGRLVDSRRAKKEDLMNKAVKENGLKCLQDVETALSKTPARFFAASGTLLGLARSGKFIEWDSDLDYGVFIDDSFTWSDLERAMATIGFKLNHQFSLNNTIEEQSYAKGYVQIDFFNYFNCDDSTFFYAFYQKNGYNYSSRSLHHTLKYRLAFFDDTKLLEIDGGSVHVPNNIEGYLESLYGETWRIPNPDWNLGDGPACKTLGDDMLGVYEKF